MASHGALVVAVALFLFGMAVTGYIHATSEETGEEGDDGSPTPRHWGGNGDLSAEAAPAVETHDLAPLPVAQAF